MEYTSKNGKHSFFEITVYRTGLVGMAEAVRKILDALSGFETENPNRRVTSWKPEIHSYGDSSSYATFVNCGIWIDHEPIKKSETEELSDLDTALRQD